jgi:hypothetical protein
VDSNKTKTEFSELEKKIINTLIARSTHASLAELQFPTRGTTGILQSTLGRPGIGHQGRETRHAQSK